MKRPEALNEGIIADAKSPVMLTITANDIKKATPREPQYCAAARAAKRQLGACDAIIMRSTLYVNTGTKEHPYWERYQTPPSLTREVVALDRGGTFEPGTFKISPFPKGQRLGDKRFYSRGNSSGKAKTPHYRHITTNIR